MKAHSPGDAMEFKSLNSTVVSTAPLPPTARITLKQETHTINHWLLCHIESNGHASKASFRVLNLESMDPCCTHTRDPWVKFRVSLYLNEKDR